MSGISFSQDEARRLVAIYSTPDVVAQREATLKRLALEMGEHVIDIGCGPGFLCESMGTQVGNKGRVLGVDVSADLIRFAQERKGGSWIDYRVGDAMKLDVPDASFDAAVSTQVIEYVPDADAAIRELFRVLRPGGRALLVDTDWDTVVWHARDAERMRRVLRAWEGHCADPRLPRTLAIRLRAAGFVLDSVEAYSIVNTAYDPSTYSYGMMELFAAFLTKANFDPAEVAGWRADLVEMGERGGYFFSVNRYFFAATKPAAR